MMNAFNWSGVIDGKWFTTIEANPVTRGAAMLVPERVKK